MQFLTKKVKVNMSHPQGQSQFELFAFWRTSATYRVRVALNLKGLVAHERIVNLDAGEQRGAEFLKINPMAAIPAFVDNGESTGTAPCTPITQSMAILEFLEESQPLPALLPSDLHGRALWDATDAELLEAVWQFRRNFEAATVGASRQQA